jgi:hypothetical protein
LVSQLIFKWPEEKKLPMLAIDLIKKIVNDKENLECIPKNENTKKRDETKEFLKSIKLQPLPTELKVRVYFSEDKNKCDKEDTISFLQQFNENIDKFALNPLKLCKLPKNGTNNKLPENYLSKLIIEKLVFKHKCETIVNSFKKKIDEKIQYLLINELGDLDLNSPGMKR